MHNTFLYIHRQSKIMKKLSAKNRLWVLVALLLLGGYFLYQLVFVNDIPVTQANVNEKVVNSLQLQNTNLRNVWGDTLSIEAGQLVVEEHRGVPNTNHIELFFTRIKTKAKVPLSPIIFLAGGPGSSATAIGTSEYFYLFRELSRFADVILMDQRGAGQSIPNLSCRNFLKTPKEITQNVQEEILNDLVKKCTQCANEFRDMGIDLSGYNSYESALDIEALRVALGYSKITLYGYSYGTTLAQVYIREFAPRVDRAILAGSIAPDHNLKLPFDAQYQFQKMDSLIKRDKKLSKYIPDFLNLVKSVHDDMRTDPPFVQVAVQDALDDDAPAIQKTLVDLVATVRPTFDMILTDDHLQMMVADNIGKDSWISHFPAFYHTISKKNYGEAGLMLRNFSRRRMPNALFFTVNASEKYTNQRWQKAVKQDETALLSHFGISYGRFPEVYEAFDITPLEGMNTAISGSTKLLLIHGELDGRTPPNLANDIAQRFPNNHRIKVENAGHNSLLDIKIMKAISHFIQDSLTTDITISRTLEFDNPVPYKYSISDTLINTIRADGVTATTDLYEKLYDNYNEVNDYIFEFKPNPLYEIVSAFIDDKDYDTAIPLLQFAITKFPDDYFLRVYLGLAYYESGDMINARIQATKALTLNFFDGNAHILLDKLGMEKV